MFHHHRDACVSLSSLVDCTVHLKLEWLNLTGSIKQKTALSLIEDAERRNLLGPHRKRFIESSSGNLGVALAAIAAHRGYEFTCVVDPNASQQSIRTIRAFGAKIAMIEQRDANGGYLGSRIEYIRQRLLEDDTLYWPNQYANSANPNAHFEMTARELHESLNKIDFLFVGAGTTGTLMGCSAYFSQYSPSTRIIAVDSIGSITFGGPSGPRHIPGLGTSRIPEVFDPRGNFEQVLTAERDAVLACRWLARTHGVLAGGSTGSVLAAIHACRDRLPETARVAALSPDSGFAYLDTIYSDDWVRRVFGNDVLLEQEEWPQKPVTKSIQHVS